MYIPVWRTGWFPAQLRRRSQRAADGRDRDDGQGEDGGAEKVIVSPVPLVVGHQDETKEGQRAGHPAADGVTAIVVGARGGQVWGAGCRQGGSTGCRRSDTSAIGRMMGRRSAASRHSQQLRRWPHEGQAGAAQAGQGAHPPAGSARRSRRPDPPRMLAWPACGTSPRSRAPAPLPPGRTPWQRRCREAHERGLSRVCFNALCTKSNGTCGGGRCWQRRRRRQRAGYLLAHRDCRVQDGPATVQAVEPAADRAEDDSTRVQVTLAAAAALSLSPRPDSALAAPFAHTR